jgi:hypothetical protein
MHGHIIVCGDDPLGLRIIEQLRAAGRDVAIVFSSDGLPDAGIANAAALICADDDDALNLEIALLARQLNPTVRVVARLGNSVLREAVAIGNGPGAILDVADLAAPSVVEACLSESSWIGSRGRSVRRWRPVASCAKKPMTWSCALRHRWLSARMTSSGRQASLPRSWPDSAICSDHALFACSQT